ncbi:MAG: methyltransferase domain-containing protein [Nanoarchaeota archaeon]|nr:methyltransferase domain-containing protein [Nanoarchaeota archaeon]
MKKLNFGCGRAIKEGWVNVDFQNGEGIDRSFDFLDYPYPFTDDTFDYVLIDNVLEHLDDPTRVMREIWRICKNGAIVEIIVPYYNSYYAYADPTHKNYFSDLSMRQTLGEVEYAHDSQRERFDIEMDLVPQRFLRGLPFGVLNVLRRFLNNVIVEIRAKARVVK